MDRRSFLSISLAATIAGRSTDAAAAVGVTRYLYVVCPGIRDYLEFGGAGILVFDIDNGHKFVKRIATTASTDAKPRNIKGVVRQCRRRSRLYFTTPETLYCVDLVTEKTQWEKALPQGCDRLAATPDGKTLFVPSFEKDTWNVVDAATGQGRCRPSRRRAARTTPSVGLDGKRVYLAGLKSPILFVADTKTHKVVDKVGPFAAAIRPFTVNGAQTLCFVNVNELLGFEIGDLTTGKKLHRVEVPGFKKGPVKRHGCPSHGIGLTPRREGNVGRRRASTSASTSSTTRRAAQARESVKLREQPGWVTFSLDGKYRLPLHGRSDRHGDEEDRRRR